MLADVCSQHTFACMCEGVGVGGGGLLWIDLISPDLTGVTHWQAVVMDRSINRSRPAIHHAT